MERRYPGEQQADPGIVRVSVALYDLGADTAICVGIAGMQSQAGCVEVVEIEGDSRPEGLAGQWCGLLEELGRLFAQAVLGVRPSHGLPTFEGCVRRRGFLARMAWERRKGRLSRSPLAGALLQFAGFPQDLSECNLAGGHVSERKQIVRALPPHCLEDRPRSPERFLSIVELACLEPSHTDGSQRDASAAS